MNPQVTSNGEILSVSHLEKHFRTRGNSGSASVVRAIDDVSFSISPQEIVGLVGESGSGKTTLARMIVRLLEPTKGTIEFNGTNLSNVPKKQSKALRRDIQMIFQDPFSSMNPRLNIGRIVGEGLKIHKIGTRSQRLERVQETLRKVGLPTDAINRYPHEFSGGQRQRIGIARALAVEPSFLIADEPVSALDVSIQGQAINLLSDLQRDMGLTVVFISHDLGVVEYIADRVIVMYLGRIVEIAPTRQLFSRPKHPYTQALLSASSTPSHANGATKIILKGEIPSPANPPSGCSFRTRCPVALPQCAQARPPERRISENHWSACIRDDIL